MDKETQERQRLVDAARTWLGTPYHHRGRVKGHGCDCAQLIAASLHEAGLVDYIEPQLYSMDWHLHRGEEKYLAQVERVLSLVDDDSTPIAKRPTAPSYRPGDVIMIQLGRVFSHSVLVTNWPFIIHAYASSRIVEESSIIGTPLAYRPIRVYSLWGAS